MTIDWDKPLLIKSSDDKEHEAFVRDTGFIQRHSDGTVDRVLECSIDGFEFKWIASSEGEDRIGIMPRVYNAKRKPKEGEWWVCRRTTSFVSCDRALFLSGGKWRGSNIDIGGEGFCNVEPLYPLIKDPDF